MGHSTSPALKHPFAGSSLRRPGRVSGGPDALEVKMPLDLSKAGGAVACVRDMPRGPLVSLSTNPTTPNDFKAAIPFPPSPPTSPESSPPKLDLSDTAISKFAYLPSSPSTPPETFDVDVSNFQPPSVTTSSFVAQVLSEEVLRSSAVVDLDTDFVPWDLAVVDDPVRSSRALYARSALGYEDVCLRENVVAVLDFADELQCDAVVVCLYKSDAHLSELLHSLLYVGGTVVDPVNVPYDAANFVLVGLQL